MLLYILRFDSCTFGLGSYETDRGGQKAQRLPSKNGDWRPGSVSTVSIKKQLAGWRPMPDRFTIENSLCSTVVATVDSLLIGGGKF